MVFDADCNAVLKSSINNKQDKKLEQLQLRFATLHK